MKLHCALCHTALEVPKYDRNRNYSCPECGNSLIPWDVTEESVPGKETARASATPGPFFESLVPVSPEGEGHGIYDLADPAESAEPAEPMSLPQKEADAQVLPERHGYTPQSTKPIITTEPRGLDFRSIRDEHGTKIVLGLVAAFVIALGWHIYQSAIDYGGEPPVYPPERWRPFKLPDGMEVSMPGAVNGRVRQFTEYALTMRTCYPDKMAAYSVQWTVEPLAEERRSLPPKTMLSAICDNEMAEARRQWTFVTEGTRQFFQQDGFDGVEQVINNPERSERIIQRFYLIGGRIYSLVAMGKGLKRNHENVERLFQSFHLAELHLAEAASAVTAALSPDLPAPAPAPTKAASESSANSAGGQANSAAPSSASQADRP
jgi:hypothetical protein